MPPYFIQHNVLLHSSVLPQVKGYFSFRSTAVSHHDYKSHFIHLFVDGRRFIPCILNINITAVDKSADVSSVLVLTDHFLKEHNCEIVASSSNSVLKF